MDYLTVELREDSFFHLRVYREIGIIGIEGGYLSSFGIFFSEAIERALPLAPSIERTFTGTTPFSVSYSILLENYHQLGWLLMKRGTFLFGKRALFIRLLSATIPPILLGFFTSMKQRGRPFTKSVISGRNSSCPLRQVNSAVKWKVLFPGTSKSINRMGDTDFRRR